MIHLVASGGGGPVIPTTYGGGSQCAANGGIACFGYLKTNWSGIFQPALIQHIELTAIAVGIGFVIAFGLALAAHRHGWVATPVTLIASLLYTIPSLTLFYILVPITGLNRYTAEIALVSYTLLILFVNSLAGLSGVNPEVRDAASGIGLTARQTLVRVEIPLALPTIIAGLRVAVVTIVSLATVAAYIIPQGLGFPILTGVQKGTQGKSELFFAGVLAILLALAADLLLVGVQRLLTPWARRRTA